MLIEKLPLLIPINAYVRIQPNHLATPQSNRILNLRDHIFQPSLSPQSLSKPWIFDLEAIVDTDCVAFFGDSGRGGEGKGFEESDVFCTEGRGPEI